MIVKALLKVPFYTIDCPFKEQHFGLLLMYNIPVSLNFIFMFPNLFNWILDRAASAVLLSWLLFNKIKAFPFPFLNSFKWFWSQSCLCSIIELAENILNQPCPIPSFCRSCEAKMACLPIHARSIAGAQRHPIFIFPECLKKDQVLTFFHYDLFPES